MKRNTISLVCLDFDGTIMLYDEEPGHFHPLIIDRLNALRTAGVEWITNSGRSLRSQLEVLDACRARGLAYDPAAILSPESLIYVRRDNGYAPMDDWQRQAEARLRALHGGFRAEFEEDLAALVVRHQPKEIYYRDDATVYCMTGSEDDKVAFVRALTELADTRPDTTVLRNGDWVAIMPEQLGKGNVLRAYLDYRGLTTGNVLAIGDHDNDISMLNGSVSDHVGCPGDAFPDVRRTVLAAGGCVAAESGALGTVEVLHHYLGRL